MSSHKFTTPVFGKYVRTATILGQNKSTQIVQESNDGHTWWTTSIDNNDPTIWIRSNGQETSIKNIADKLLKRLVSNIQKGTVKNIHKVDEKIFKERLVNLEIEALTRGL